MFSLTATAGIVAVVTPNLPEQRPHKRLAGVRIRLDRLRLGRPSKLIPSVPRSRSSQTRDPQPSLNAAHCRCQRKRSFDDVHPEHHQR